MGILDFVKSQFIEVIEWVEADNEVLAWRFPVQGQEIKMGAQLTVREGQVAIFVNEGKMADVFQPGLYTLETQNLPILTKLKSWKYGFNSPFKAEVYFMSTRHSLNLKWGTQNPIMLRDQDFGAVRLRAFGMFSIKVKDPALFLREIVGTDGEFTQQEIEGFLRRQLISSFSTVLGQLSVPALDLAGNYERIGQLAQEKMAKIFEGYGLNLAQFVIENISLPPELEKALDERASMGMIGNLNAYKDFQTAQAIRDAAKQPGSLAGAAMGIGAGLGLGNAMAQAFSPQPQKAESNEPSAKQTTPCPKCHQEIDHTARFCNHCGTKLTPPGQVACVKCSEPIPAASKFCAHCGSPQRLACSQCGAELASGTKFCSECGHKVG